MNRRGFFQAFVGGSSASLVGLGSQPTQAQPARAKQPVVMQAQTNVPVCECGLQFVVWMDGGFSPSGRRAFMECSNPACKHYLVPLAIPTIPVYSADADTVRRVRGYQEERREAEEYARQVHLVQLNSRLDPDAIAKSITEGLHSRGCEDLLGRCL